MGSDPPLQDPLLRIKGTTKLVFKNFIFRVISFNAFWKFLRFGNSAWEFLRVNFRSSDFSGS